jgi:hypothetical protein
VIRRGQAARQKDLPRPPPRWTLFSIPFKSRMTDADAARLRASLDLVTYTIPKPGLFAASPGLVPLDSWSGLFLERGAGEDEWALEARTWGIRRTRSSTMACTRSARGPRARPDSAAPAAGDCLRPQRQPQSQRATSDLPVSCADCATSNELRGKSRSTYVATSWPCRSGQVDAHQPPPSAAGRVPAIRPRAAPGRALRSPPPGSDCAPLSVVRCRS